jgi:ATP synthase F0 subunit c
VSFEEASKMNKVLLSLITTLPIIIGAVIAALSMRRISVSAVEGMTRQPEIAPQLFTAMLIGMALIEALCIYCLVVSLMLAGTIAGG